MIKRVISWCLFGLAVIAGIGVFATSILAYFVQSYNPTTRQYFDGLGRPLERLVEGDLASYIFAWIFANDTFWPGWFWFALDFVWFWGGLALAYGLFRLGDHLRSE